MEYFTKEDIERAIQYYLQSIKIVIKPRLDNTIDNLIKK
jgi:hypothetical protein